MLHFFLLCTLLAASRGSYIAEYQILTGAEDLQQGVVTIDVKYEPICNL